MPPVDDGAVTDMRIAALRAERGWTQEHLASVSGVGVRTVQRLEAGGDASLETLRRVAAALEVPVPVLFASTGAAESADAVGTESTASAAPEDQPGPPRGWWRVAVLVGVLALTGSLLGIGVATARPAAFEATTRAFVSMDSGSVITLLEASKYVQAVAQADAQLVTEPIVLDRAAVRLAADGGDLRGSVSAHVESGTAVLTISARGSSPTIAIRRADAVVQSLIEVLPRVTPSGVTGGQRITQLDAPTTSIDLGGLIAGGGIGLGGGFLVGTAVVLVRRRPPGPPDAVGRLAIA